MPTSLQSPISLKWDIGSQSLFLLFIAPLLITCTICVMTFVWLHNIHTAKLQSNIYALFSQHLDTQLANPKVTNENIEQSVASLLHTDQFESVVILDSAKNVLNSFGLPNKHRDFNWVNNHKSEYQHATHGHYVKLISRPGQQSLWIVATIDKTNSTLLFVQTLLWGLCCVFLCALLVVWFAIRCYKRLVFPLVRLHHELKQAINENFEFTLTPASQPLYAPLIATTQQLIEMNKGLQEGTQKYIEQATQELRESLETVEIQNIELDIARKNALQASADKSELLASTSHEIRTPLNGIVGFTHLLLKTQLDDQQRDYLATIEQSAQGLLTVINDVIDYSRLESGTMTFEYKPVNVRDMVCEVLQVFAPSANQNHQRLIQLIDPQIPTTLLGDPLRLKQVINNLIHCLASIDSTADIVIECAKQHKKGSKTGLQFAVKSPNCQLQEMVKQQIYATLSSQTTPISDAASIGLSIAKALAERMQGTIRFDNSEVDVAFYFSVDLGQAEAALDSGNHFDSSAVRVLVFDNHSLSRQETMLNLRTWDISPVIEQNPNNLRRAAITSRANLVILDYATDGRRFNKEKLENCLKELLTVDNLHIAVIAPSNIRRQIEHSGHWHDIHFLTRPLVRTELANIIKRISGLPETEPDHASGQHLKILVADDNPANSKLVTAFLQQANHNIRAVENGALALAAYKEDKPDIIFMDVQMPEMDGLQATSAIRELEQDNERTPIVALTANALPEQRARILMAGMDDYLTKPVSDDDLRHALHRWLDPKRKLSKTQTMPAITERSAPQIESQTSTTKPPPPPKIPDQTKPSKPDVKTTALPIGATFSLKKALSLTKNNQELAYDMLTMLAGELPDYRATISEALQTCNLTTLHEVIHKLKGGASYSGFISLTSQAQNADAKLSHANQMTTELNQEVLHLINAIDEALTFIESVDMRELFELSEP